MAFTGNLNAVALTDIVQLIGLAQKEGAADVKPNPLRRLYDVFRTLYDDSSEKDFESALSEAPREVFDRAIVFRVDEKELCGISGYSLNQGGTGEQFTARLTSSESRGAATHHWKMWSTPGTSASGRHQKSGGAISRGVRRAPQDGVCSAASGGRRQLYAGALRRHLHTPGVRRPAACA
jgi:hypothetical protein